MPLKSSAAYSQLESAISRGSLQFASNQTSAETPLAKDYHPHPTEILPYGTRIKPLSGKVLVRRDAPEKVSSFGIVYPGNGKVINQGTVLAVAAYHRNRQNGIRSPMQLQVGNKVLLGDSGGLSVPVYTKDGEVEILFIVRETDFQHTDEVLAVVEDE